MNIIHSITLQRSAPGLGTVELKSDVSILSQPRGP